MKKFFVYLAMFASAPLALADSFGAGGGGGGGRPRPPCSHLQTGLTCQLMTSGHHSAQKLEFVVQKNCTYSLKLDENVVYGGKDFRRVGDGHHTNYGRIFVVYENLNFSPTGPGYKGGDYVVAGRVDGLDVAGECEKKSW